jgi:hypothetical protein
LEKDIIKETNKDTKDTNKDIKDNKDKKDNKGKKDNKDNTDNKDNYCSKSEGFHCVEFQVQKEPLYGITVNGINQFNGLKLNQINHYQITPFCPMYVPSSFPY